MKNLSFKNICRIVPARMLKGAMSALIILAMICNLAGCIFDNDKDDYSKMDNGDPCPAFTVRDFNGYYHTVPDETKPSLIFFFNTECCDCVRQFPIIQRLYEAYQNKIDVIGVSPCNASYKIKEFIAEHHYSFPIAEGTYKTIYDSFATAMIPRVYFVKDGIIQARNEFDNVISYDEAEGIIESLFDKTKQ